MNTLQFAIARAYAQAKVSPAQGNLATLLESDIHRFEQMETGLQPATRNPEIHVVLRRVSDPKPKPRKPRQPRTPSQVEYEMVLQALQVQPSGNLRSLQEEIRISVAEGRRERMMVAAAIAGRQV